MKHVKCIICKETLPLNSDASICDRVSCQAVIDTRKNLIERIRHFKEFFQGKLPGEGAYKEYLTLVGLEDKYYRFAYGVTGERLEPKVCRRVWFSLNVAQGHHEWNDEFGRIYSSAE